MRLKIGTFASSGSIPLSISYSTTNFSRGSNSSVLTPVVTGGSGTKTYSYTGTLPPDTSFNTSTGQITGPSSLKGVYTPRVFYGLNVSTGLSNVTDQIDSFAVASDGSIYIAGNTRGYVVVNGITYTPQMFGTTSAFMGFVAKYNPDGSWAWFRPLQSNLGTSVGYISLNPAEDAVYAAGYVNSASVTLEGVTYTGVNSDGTNNLFAGKISSSGVWEWAKLVQSGGTGSDRWNCVVADKNGSGAYFSGFSNSAISLGNGISVGSAGRQSGITAKIQSNGTWSWGVTEIESGSTTFNDITIDSSNNIYVIGSTTATNTQAILIKYNSSGSQIFKKYVSLTSNNVFGNAVALDQSGNIHISGNTNGSLPGFSNSGGLDLFVRKYDTSGNVLWTQQQGGTKDENSRSISVDSSGNVYIVSHISGAVGSNFTFGGVNYPLQGSLDTYVAKFSSSGTPQWAKLYATSGTEFGTKVLVDNGGRVHTSIIIGGTNFTWNLGDTTHTVVSSYDSVIGMIDPSNGNFLGNAQPGFPATLNVSVTESGVTASTNVTLTYG